MSHESGTWAVVGASGFVGSAVAAELRGRGLAVKELAAPRLESTAGTAAEIVDAAHATVGATQAQGGAPDAAGSDAAGPDLAADIASFRNALDGVDVVVNAAGLATPGDGESPALTGANALLPAVVALLAREAGAHRFVHLSSASVQGQNRTIDESPARAPFSAYSRSKTLGEEALELLAGETGHPGSHHLEITTIRATSVQGPGRPTTLSLVKVAGSPLASVASPGNAPTPVSSIDGLAWFVAETGLHAGPVPAIVLQPWERLTVSDVLTDAGGRAPLMIPAWLCRTVLATGYFVSRILGERLHGPIRRVELMWFGQGQVPGWAESAGLVPEPFVREVLEQARVSRP